MQYKQHKIEISQITQGVEVLISTPASAISLWAPDEQQAKGHK